MLPDIRQVIDSLAGKTTKLFPSNQKGIGFQWFGLRQADYTKPCGCGGSLGSTEPTTCSRCLSTGYLFSDYLVKGYGWMGLLGFEYNSKPGLMSTQQRNLVLQFDKTINKFDFVLELDQDPDTGKIRQPLRITRQFKVQDSVPIRGDNAKLEFWKCTVEERNVDSGRPGPEGTTFKYLGNRSNGEPE